MIKDLKEFQQLLKLCRKQGVTEVNLCGVVVKFGELPRKTSDDDSDEIEGPDALSPEQLMFFSAPSAEGNDL